MPMSEQVLQKFHKMFSDAGTLTRGTEDTLYWMECRDYLRQSLALEYLRTKNQEALFQALLLSEIDYPSEFGVVSEWLAFLRTGEKLEVMPHSWEGAWAVITSTIYRGDYAARKALQDRYFKRHSLTG